MQPMKILVLDDDRDLAESLADILEARGHHVELAFNGPDALELFRVHEFDIALMDVRLPGMNGVETYLEMRKIKPDAKAVMMTAFSVERLLEEAIENGALGILRKPFAVDDVLQTLETVRPRGVVLVADDDPDFTESLSPILSDHGYRCVVARDGQSAIDGIMREPIDVLVLDLQLPILSGIEVYMELQRRNVALPTIIVTGAPLDESGDFDALKSFATTGCLHKPIDPGRLLNLVDSIAPRAQVEPAMAG